MIKMIPMNFAEFMERKFLEWQTQAGKRKTVDDFAAYIGVSQPTLSMWMNGKRTPGAENIKLLVELFGLDVYDALGLERPDPDLHYIEAHWVNLPEGTRKKIREEAEAYITKKKK